MAQFAVMTLSYSKFIKQVDTPIFSVTPKNDPDLIKYPNELLKTTKSEQQGSSFLFPTPEIPGTFDDHIRIQTSILSELWKIKETGIMNPMDNIGSENTPSGRLDRTDTIVKSSEIQAKEDFLIENKQNFARHV